MQSECECSGKGILRVAGGLFMAQDVDDTHADAHTHKATNTGNEEKKKFI